jgi:prefoldin subunit 5
MSRPTRFLWRMVIFLVAVAALAGVLSETLFFAFATNPEINGVIAAVLLLGIAYNLRSVANLNDEVYWLDTFRRNRPGITAIPVPKLLAPVANMLESRKGERLNLSTPALRSILDTVQSRLDESRELSRYMVGLLIFLGLLGTFWGLLRTIGAISEVIGAMSVGTGDLGALFNQLKSGLERPLAGMGIAFSTSMFGLAGSLVLGFLDLTAGQAQNRFYNEFEEWLSQQTRLGSGALGDAGEGNVPAYVQALLEQTAENMEALQRTLSRGEESRVSANQAVVQLTERLGALTDQMRQSQAQLSRMAEAQAELRPVLARLADGAGGGGLDEASRAHLRNLELYMARLLEELMSGRAQSVADIRNEIKILTRTIAAISEEPRQ